MAIGASEVSSGWRLQTGEKCSRMCKISVSVDYGREVLIFGISRRAEFKFPICFDVASSRVEIGGSSGYQKIFLFCRSIQSVAPRTHFELFLVYPPPHWRGPGKNQKSLNITGWMIEVLLPILKEISIVVFII